MSTIRIGLTTVTGLKISPARVRKQLDQKSVNGDKQVELAELKMKLENIKKEGYMGEKPVKPSKKAFVKPDKSFDKDTYKVARDKYNVVLTQYKKYKSAKYETLKKSHELLRKLVKVVTLKKKKEENQLSAGGDKQLSQLLDKVSSTMDVSKVEEKLEELSKLEGMDIMCNKAKLSHDRIRFSPVSSISLAAALEFVARDILTKAANRTITCENKIIKCSHCITGEIVSPGLAPLINHLPSMEAERKKQADREEEAKVHAEYKKCLEASEKKAAKKEHRPPRKTPKFQKTVKDVKVKKDKEDSSFKHYVSEIWESMKKENVEYNSKKLRISDNFKNFVSDLLVELIDKIASIVKCLVAYKNGKTVGFDTIKVAVDIMFGKYANSSVPEQTALSAFMKEKADVYEAHEALANKLVGNAGVHTEAPASAASSASAVSSAGTAAPAGTTSSTATVAAASPVSSPPVMPAATDSKPTERKTNRRVPPKPST